jgi:hypothetical protein
MNNHSYYYTKLTIQGSGIDALNIYEYYVVCILAIPDNRQHGLLEVAPQPKSNIWLI